MSSRPSSSSQQPRPVPSIEFSNLSLDLYTHEHVRLLRWKRKLERKVVSELFGLFECGTVTTILGPSGCGKTTLMNAIAGRAVAGDFFSYSFGVSVSVGGASIDPLAYRSNFGFVHAHETLYPTDTPVEALEFVKKLRDSDETEDEQETISNLLEKLKLGGCRDTMIGSATLKGLSSGEQKRVSVGIEMIPRYKFLFLDEPTTGLDSATAFDVVNLLCEYASLNNACIVCVLHQPSNKIFDLVHEVVFMTRDGRICYWGPTRNVVDHFASRGYTCPSEYNPADYVMFILQTVGDSAIDELVHACEPVLAQKRMQIESLRQHPVVEIDEIFLKRRISIRKWFRELFRLVRREYRSTVRDLTVVVLRVGLALLFGTVIAFLFFQVGDNPAGAMESSHIGLVATLGIFALVSSAQSLIIAYSLERPVMLREYASGLYTVTGYCLSKDILEYPVVVLLVLIYLTLGYLIGGLKGNFLLLLLAMILVGLASAAISFLLAAAASTVDMGAQLGTFVLVIETLLSGFFVRVDQVPQVLRWIQWANPLRYGLSIMFIAEFHNEPGHETLFATNQINPDMILFYIFMLVGLIVILRVTGIVVLWLRTRKSVV